MSLTTTIKSIQDVMRKDVGVDGDAQRIGQLVWILFLKIWDDREQELAFIEDDYVSPLADVTWIDARGNTRTAADLRWGAWAADAEGITGDIVHSSNAHQHISAELRDKILQLFTSSDQASYAGSQTTGELKADLDLLKALIDALK